MKTGQLSSGQMVGRLFKKPTKSARKQGEARVMLDDMVRRAEKKIAEAERHSVGTTQGAEEKAEALAKELFHRPGSMLTSDEIALMNQESGCANVREAPTCKFPQTKIYRTIDGTCNNDNFPLYGASETPFRRMVPPFYEDGIDSLRGDIQAMNEEQTDGMFALDPFSAPAPSARLISKTIIFRNDSREEDDFTHLLMQWGQFLDHDLDLSPELEAECENCEFSEICRPIRVAREDPVFGLGTPQDGDCLRFGRSLPACSQDPPGSYSPREQLNAITSFIDASNVYGSNTMHGNAVRLFEDGLLKEGDPALPGQKPALPIDKDDIMACLNAQNCFLAGDVRANEQIALTIMHTLWFREHNRIARELKGINPFWNDERLFQETRRIVGALLQKITYEDYLPKVMGPTFFNQLIGPYPGYDPRVDPGVPNSFATAAYRYGHSLVRPEFARLGSNFQPLPKGPLNLVDAFFNPDQFRLSMGTDPILRGLISENPLRLDSFINDVLLNRLFERAQQKIPGMDLAALNIQRGRDHGLPPLPVFAEFCRRKFPFLPRSAFEQEIDTVRFLQLHGSLNDVDPWMGGIAETRLPGSFIGPTFACIFGITFDNVRNGDRFWYENPQTFTQRQLREIQKGSVARVICDNSDNINRVQPDAFLSNQTRIPCREIPSLDLNAWREKPCFARVRVEMQNIDPIFLQVFSQTTSVITSMIEEILAAQQQFVCMPVNCPRTARGTRVLFSTDIGNKVKFAENSLLAPNQFTDRVDRYRAVWPEAAFDSPSNGVFRSLEACERAGDVFALDLSMQTEVEKLAAAQSDDDEEEEDDILHFFDIDGEGTSDGGSEEQAEKEEIASDQALTAELEEALKNLAL
jgi:peroxidase